MKKLNNLKLKIALTTLIFGLVTAFNVANQHANAMDTSNKINKTTKNNLTMKNTNQTQPNENNNTIENDPNIIKKIAKYKEKQKFNELYKALELLDNYFQKLILTMKTAENFITKKNIKENDDNDYQKSIDNFIKLFDGMENNFFTPLFLNLQKGFKGEYNSFPKNISNAYDKMHNLFYNINNEISYYKNKKCDLDEKLIFYNCILLPLNKFVILGVQQMKSLLEIYIINYANEKLTQINNLEAIENIITYSQYLLNCTYNDYNQLNLEFMKYQLRIDDYAYSSATMLKKQRTYLHQIYSNIYGLNYYFDSFDFTKNNYLSEIDFKMEFDNKKDHVIHTYNIIQQIYFNIFIIYIDEKNCHEITNNYEENIQKFAELIEKNSHYFKTFSLEMLEFIDFIFKSLKNI